MSRNASKNSGSSYVERANLAIDYILQNLDQPLPLEVLADVAGFSPFHFHRIFKSLLGETLNDFVTRVRLEHALSLMSHAPRQSFTEIALTCGFSSSSDFSRTFRKRYGVPPSVFDVDVFRAQRREEWQAAVADPSERHKLDRLPPGANPDGFEATLRAFPARRVAYIRVHDSYRPGAAQAAATRLLDWATTHGVADNQWMGYMWDDPEIVEHSLCRYDVAVVAPDVEPSGEIGAYDFPAMTVAQVEIRGRVDLEVRALEWLFRTWLPASGYAPAALPCFEAWVGRPFAHGDEHYELDVQLPVERC